MRCRFRCWLLGSSKKTQPVDAVEQLAAAKSQYYFVSCAPAGKDNVGKAFNALSYAKLVLLLSLRYAVVHCAHRCFLLMRWRGQEALACLLERLDF